MRSNRIVAAFGAVLAIFMSPAFGQDSWFQNYDAMSGFGRTRQCFEQSRTLALRLRACNEVLATSNAYQRRDVAFSAVDIYIAEGQFVPALKILADMQSEVPVDAPGYLNDVLLEDRAEAHALAGQFNLAFKEANEQIKDYPHSPAAYNSACYVRAIADRELSQALIDCNLAIHMQQPEASILDSRALVNYRLGRQNTALADANAALGDDPSTYSSLFLRGIIEQQKGDTSAAVHDLNRACEKNRELAPLFAQMKIRPVPGSAPECGSQK